MCCGWVSLWLRFEGPAGSVGRGVGRGVGRRSLDGLVGHDPGGELLLSLLEAGAGGAIQRVHLERDGEELSEPESSRVASDLRHAVPPHLFKHNERAHGQRGEERRNQ